MAHVQLSDVCHCLIKNGSVEFVVAKEGGEEALLFKNGIYDGTEPGGVEWSLVWNSP